MILWIYIARKCCSKLCKCNYINGMEKNVGVISGRERTWIFGNALLADCLEKK